MAKVAPKDSAAQPQMRALWSNRVITASSQLSFVRPTRFGTGRWMTVGICAEPYLKVDADGHLDLAATNLVLRRAQDTMAAVVKGTPNLSQ